MASFGAEFPVDPNRTKAQFIALGLAWVRGIKNSTLAGNVPASINDDDDVALTGSDGELVNFRSVNTSFGFVVGLRHEKPDDDGRVWRTEAVLTNRGRSATLRLNGQCLAMETGVNVRTPNKPYVIKMLLDDGWGSHDGVLKVSSEPYQLGDLDLDWASQVITGETDGKLPFVYVSTSNGRYTINPKILAEKLSGLAHVIVEPSRDFSFRLSEKTEGRNPYDGTVSICAPGQGVFRRIFLGGAISSQKEMFQIIQASIVNRNVAKQVLNGWTWSDIQDEMTKRLQEKLRDHGATRATVDELERTFSQIVDEKNKDIAELRMELARALESKDSVYQASESVLQDEFVNSIGSELYPGEFNDRSRLIFEGFLKDSSEENTDIRTRKFAEKALKIWRYSGRAAGYVDELKRAAKTGRRFGIEMARILARIGYRQSEDGKHIKLSPPADDISGPVIVLPKTPSDSAHGGGNQASDISNALGFKRMM